ncbi:IS110 family transposase [Weissella minor]|uniref:IS110 family transposase n=1 Tax=Weissella minor TaxID=1620 RepID=UPI003AF298F7
MEVSIGVDVGKKNLNYCVLSVDGEILDEGMVGNNLIGFEKIFELVQEFNSIAIFEATGVYSSRLQYFFDLNDQAYVRINPLQAKKEMDSLRGSKNDKIDAKKLAKLQLRRHFAPTPQEKRVYKELRRQHHFYQTITQEGANAKNRVQRILQETFSNLTDAIGISSDVFYQVVLAIPHVAIIKDLDENEIQHLLDDALKHKPTKIKLAKKLNSIKDVSTVSVDLESFAVTELRYWAEKVIKLDEIKETLISNMIKYEEELPEIKIIKSIPGLGDIAALGFVAEVGDIKRFPTPQKLNAYIGIDLRFNDSGQLKTNGYISRRGSNTARKLLYMGFMHIVMADTNNNVHIAKWYKSRTRNINTGKKKYIVGGMDRTIKLIHHLVINDEFYQN